MVRYRLLDTVSSFDAGTVGSRRQASTGPEGDGLTWGLQGSCEQSREIERNVDAVRSSCMAAYGGLEKTAKNTEAGPESWKQADWRV